MIPIVTVAIPIYNAAPFLAAAIQSCINQTFYNWELLLMEDGSTDDSLQIAQRFAEADNRIKVISDGENKGLVYRLNQSVSMARGKYYARMDADDIMTVNRLEKQITFLDSHVTVDVVGSSIMLIDAQNQIVGSGYAKGKVKSFFHPTILGHTSWFRKHPYASWATRAEDFELWTRTSDSSEFYTLESPLLFYREFGVPSFHKTCQTLSTLLVIFRKYKHYHKPFIWFIKHSLVTCAKIFTYSIFYVMGHLDFIIKRRKRVKVPVHLCLTPSDLAHSIEDHIMQER